jgi:hypothetical protein
VQSKRGRGRGRRRFNSSVARKLILGPKLGMENFEFGERCRLSLLSEMEMPPRFLVPWLTYGRSRRRISLNGNTSRPWRAQNSGKWETVNGER